MKNILIEYAFDPISLLSSIAHIRSYWMNQSIETISTINKPRKTQIIEQHPKWSFYHSAAERFTKFKWILGNIFIDLPNVAIRNVINLKV